METPISKVLKDIGKEYSLDDSIINPVIQKLSAEFFFKVKDMKNLSLDVWKSLGLPVNLFFILNELYQNALNQSSQITNQPPQQPPQQIPLQQQKQQIFPPQNIQKPQNSNQTQHHLNSQKEELNNYFAIIVSESDDIEKTKSLFKLLHSILTNISKNPHEDKYRRVNYKKINEKYPSKALKNFLLHINFKELDDSYIIFTGPVDPLSQILPELNQFIKANKLAESTFNPYQSSIATLNQNEEKLKNISRVNFDDSYKQEMDRRKEIMKNTKVKRAPKAYQLSENFSINNVIAEMNERDDNLMFKNEDEKLIYKNAMDLIKENANDRFTLKSRTRFESLMKSPLYVKSDIRLKFPDSYILEGSFGLFETVKDICLFVQNYLNNPGNTFVISTTPPPKKYNKLNETIYDLKLYPQVLMYVNFDKEYDGLRKDKIGPIKIKMEN